ncbi:MAG TPA: multicopper oxidase family protein [Microlunatus sp.]|nr:multicopper oxidase family protein [Microlunatus sp.]
MTTRSRRALRVWLPILATIAVIAPLAWMWFASRVPASYSLMDMGYLDYGGGPQPDPSVAGHADHQGDPHAGHVMRPITDLVADPRRPADVKVELTAASAPIDVGGQQLDGFTLNGSTPGPTITATEGQLVEVRLINHSVSDGVTLHWHGVDVPNAMDGVAGVTQDTVPVGAEFTYRFVADRAGSYWYHSHQVADPQVRGGLFGGLVIRPRTAAGAPRAARDVLALAHTYGAVRTINGRVGDLAVPAKPGERVRVRVANTDNVPMPLWSDTPYRVVALDGTEVHQPSVVSDRGMMLTAGGRADLEVTVPADGSARLQLSRGTAVVMGEPDGAAVPPQPGAMLDLLAYGTPAPLGFEPARAVRQFDYRVGRRPGFVKGRPGLFWSINGHLYPNVPMYVVREGEVVTMRIDNRSGQVHPMHLHGHRAVVLSRNGVMATGSPWWVDSLNVEDGETYEIAFVADNPGLWMDHCHNLEHAEDGMVAHLMYEGWDTPFRIGGTVGNQPE